LPSETPRGEPLQPLSPATHSSATLGLGDLTSRVGELVQQHQPFRLEVATGLRSSVFRDHAESPRVLFLSNTTATPQIAKLEAPYLNSAVDALDGDAFHATVGALEVPLSPHCVRMLELK
jgi:hypothetical protein